MYFRIEPFKCINCVRNKRASDHAAKPAMIAHMEKKVASTYKIVKTYSETTSRISGSNEKNTNNQELIKITKANASNIKNMVLLFIEMFKHINEVQSDLDLENPTYIPRLLKYYLGEHSSNQITRALIKINQEDNCYNEHE